MNAINVTPMQQLQVVLNSLADTQRVAQQVAQWLVKGDVVTLAGEVGAGKTTFAQFLIGALSPQPVEVTSPTFTLLQTYPIRYANGAVGECYHYDLYRIDNPSALVELGFDEASREVMLIEWPEHLGDYPLAPTLALGFRLGVDGTRTLTLHFQRPGLTW